MDDAPFALIPLCLAAWIAAGCLNTESQDGQEEVS
jgi:hypothetical protein